MFELFRNSIACSLVSNVVVLLFSALDNFPERKSRNMIPVKNVHQVLPWLMYMQSARNAKVTRSRDADSKKFSRGFIYTVVLDSESSLSVLIGFNLHGVVEVHLAYG